MKKLSIIIVNYNVCYFLEQVLLSIKKATADIDIEVIVVDNNSADNSVGMVRHKFPNCILIDNKANVGFSKANNQGIRIAKGQYILLLNPDTVLEEDTLEKCCLFMDQNPVAGAVGVMMVDGTGEFLPESKRGLPTPWVAFFKVFGLAALFPMSRKFGKYHLGFLDKNSTHEIDVLSGAFMFMRKSALDKVGLLDEDYFMYGEDIDLSYRIVKGGFKNYYYPETRIIHYKGESTKRSSLNYVFIFYQAMIIFARKHFSSRNADIFSVLIHVAIYLRAGASILLRIGKQLALPFTDFLLLFAGMYFFKNYYEENFKGLHHFPSEYILYAVPAYICMWLVTNYFSGGYDRFVRTTQIVRGAIIGTLFISAISNFFDVYRYSKALILIGGLWAAVAMVVVRIGIHFFKYRTLALGEINKKKIAIVGNYLEGNRAQALLQNSKRQVDIIGYVFPKNADSGGENYLGDIGRLNEVIRIYGIDELIFCSKDFSANDIIECMMTIDNAQIDFKILPDDSDYIIGSNSKNAAGEFYSLNLDLNIIQKSAKRNKRVFDIGMGFIFLLASPIIMWLVKNPKNFIKNSIQVLLGKNTWVGFTKQTSIQVPQIKPGIINPTTHLETQFIDESTLNRLNMIYAKNYTVYSDLILVFKSFKILGA